MSIFLVIVIVAVIVLRRRAPLWGALLGTSLPVALTAWGLWAYARGRSVGLLHVPLSRPVFLAIMCAWAALEAGGLWRAIASRSRRG